MLKESVGLGIAVIIREEDQLTRASKGLITLECFDVEKRNLFRGVNRPHLSLIQARVSLADLKTVTESFGRTQFKSIDSLQPTKWEIWAKRILFLNVHRSRPLTILHRQAFNLLMPFRLPNTGSADPQKFYGLSLNERKSLKQFDYPFVGPAFKPHFTLGHLKNSKIQSWSVPAKLQTLSPTTLVLFEVGPLGIIKKILAKKTIRSGDTHLIYTMRK